MYMSDEIQISQTIKLHGILTQTIANKYNVIQTSIPPKHTVFNAQQHTCVTVASSLGQSVGCKLQQTDSSLLFPTCGRRSCQICRARQSDVKQYYSLSTFN